MTVTREQVEAAGEQLDQNMEYISILTKEHFDSVMCEIPLNRTPVSAAMEPPSPLQSRPSAPEWLASNVVEPLYNSSWALPAGLGARDFYRDVYRPASMLNGLFTEVYEKTTRGQTYVIIKGDRAQRTLLTGTRYRADNPKILEAGIGRDGAAAAKPTIWGGMKVALFIGVALEVFLWLVEDDHSFSDLIGGIITEAGKGAVAAGLATLVYGAAAGATALAFAPIGLFVLVGAGVGFGLNILDSEYDLKEKVRAGTAAAFEWLEYNTGSVGRWTAEQCDEIEVALDEAVASMRRGIAESVRESDSRLEGLIEQSEDAGILGRAAYSRQIQSEAMTNSVMRLLKTMMGN
ncbi:MAG: hypothetical protein HRU39_18450 [Salinicola sp.]|uniref:hypothetical protein n=1 Tax=Salinicola sp. TaxID=1978524 RepID=UPI001D417BF8|nr:hypothetical protein [Salinicola sp.]NRB57936.1 hypothetical protein [Salinicola sp.]